MAARRANAVYLPDVRASRQRRRSRTRSRDALRGAELVVSAIPSHGCRAVMRAPRRSLARGRRDRQRDEGARGRHAAAHVGGDRAGGRARRIRSSCCRAELRRRSRAPAADGGPRGVAATPAAIELVQPEFRGPYFRLYGSDDVVGVEIGGAMKNVIAIAAGVVEGLGLGHNALAALITRGLAEVTRLACAAGGRRETLAGLSGLGDLVLTCTGKPEPQSPRRHRAGARPPARRDPRRHEDDRRRRADDRRRARARRALRRRAADRDADGRGARAAGPTCARRSTR